MALRVEHRRTSAMERQELQKKLEKPFLEGKEIKNLLISVLTVSDSQSRSIYHDMRNKYVREAKAKDVIVFGTQIPTSFALDYFQKMGITKDYLLSKVS